MGLFLGASVFTTMEFITFFVNLLSNLLSWKHKDDDKTNDNQASRLTRDDEVDL